MSLKSKIKSQRIQKDDSFQMNLAKTRKAEDEACSVQNPHNNYTASKAFMECNELISYHYFYILFTNFLNVQSLFCLIGLPTPESGPSLNNLLEERWNSVGPKLAQLPTTGRLEYPNSEGCQIHGFGKLQLLRSAS